MKIRFLSLLLMAALLTSCGGGTSSTGDTTPADTVGGDSTEPAETGPTPVLPEETFGGRTFRVSLRDYSDGPTAFYVEEINGDVLNDAIWKRMANVSEKLDVTFETSYESGDIDGQTPINAVRAGEEEYQLILAKSRKITTWAMEGLCFDWNELPYVDFSQPWWNGGSQEYLNIGSKVYLVLDELTHDNLANTATYLFNKDILDKYNIAYPYDMVREGTWTFDAMAEIARKTSEDLNGDTKMNIAEDQFGYVATGWGSPLSVLLSADQTICEINGEGKMELTINTQRTVDVYEKFFAFMDGDYAFMDSDGSNKSRQTAFSEGRITFEEKGFGSILNLRDMKAEFGILPIPKFDEKVDGYRSKVDAGCNGLMVPVTISDPDFVSAVIEAICYENDKLVIPAYYDTVLQGKATRDDDSVEMLDIIRDSRVFDTGYFMLGTGSDGYPFADIGYFMTKDADHNFASHYAAYEAGALWLINEINTKYE